MNYTIGDLLDDDENPEILTKNRRKMEFGTKGLYYLDQISEIEEEGDES